MFLDKGQSVHMSLPPHPHMDSRILEYATREDADRALKDLDGRDLRGKVVRVAFDENVCTSWLKTPLFTVMSACRARQLSEGR